MEDSPMSVRVWGDLACFTRPDMKVERVSYAVPTPSAARGILEAIFWKPEFRWIVLETRVLKPIRYASLLRNEVRTKASYGAVSRWEETDGHFVAAESRTQRHTLALADVDYVILAQIELAEGVDAHPAKYRDQFRRRVQRGQCHARPCLGCREFAAYFGPATCREPPIDESMDLGLTLYDMDYGRLACADDPPDAPKRNAPVFFEARLEHGVLSYPAPEEVGLCF
jgi:CRISPR-associated protein Cas5d